MARGPIVDVTQLRHALHAHPRIADDESDTAARIAAFLEAGGVHVTRGVGGHGVLARVGAPGPGPLLRADLDGLPLVEASGVAHAATNGAHHACGHDGHMAMLAGALVRMSHDKTVYGLFQPAEETGHGMLRCLEDLDIEVTHCFAIHNLPGVPLGTVQVRQGTSALASTGLRIELQGRRSHASEPEKGINPIPTAARIIQAVDAAPGTSAMVEVRGGGPTYGTSAGDAMVGMTLRGSTEEVDAMIVTALKAIGPEVEASHERIEPFPACNNDDAAVGLVQQAAKAAGMACHAPDPYPWSEDFGYAMARWPGALIGLGSGDISPLHDSKYDFPDALLEPGIRFWLALAEVA